MNTITVDFKNLALTITKTREEWIDELAEFTLELAYLDGEYANGILDDFLRTGFKGFYNMTDTELTGEIIEHLESNYDTLEVKEWTTAQRKTNK